MSDQGDASATLSLSRYYLNEPNQDSEKAISFLEKGIQQESPQCCLELSRIYRGLYSCDIPLSIEKSVKFLEIGENLDDDSCRCELGNLYRTGYENGQDYLLPDHKKAAELFQISKESGSTVGPVMLAIMYRDGQIGAPDIVEFAFNLLPYIEKDNRARVMLENEAKKKENQRIIQLSRSAYVYNDKGSYLEIAKIYLKKKECSHYALCYFRQAAAGEEGLPEARAWSAILGNSLERRFYIRILQQDSSPDAQYWLGFFWYKMTYLSDALDLWAPLAEKGHKLSLSKLIDIYKRSIDPEDWKMANKYLKKGSSLPEGNKMFKILWAKTQVTGQLGRINLIKASDVFYQLDSVLFINLKRLLRRSEYWDYVRSFIEKRASFRPDCVAEFLI